MSKLSWCLLQISCCLFRKLRPVPGYVNKITFDSKIPQLSANGFAIHSCFLQSFVFQRVKRFMPTTEWLTGSNMTTYVSYLLCGTQADKPDKLCLIHKTELIEHGVHKQLIYIERWQSCYAVYGDETTHNFTAKPSILTSVRSTDHQFFISLTKQQSAITNW
jgi:hypothetical protein